jgi:hypothetical protein
MPDRGGRVEAVEYQRFIEDMVAWAVGEPTVIGLIAVGSTAALTHDPDEWSDHDVFVITTAGASAGLLRNPSWLPDAERVVMWHTETVDGRAAVYDDGHLVELAVFEAANVPSLSVNDYRVLVDKSDLTARLAALKRDTTLRAAENDTPLDNLDPYRRIGVGHPEICRRLNTALAAPLPELAETMLLLLEEHLVDRVPAFSAESLAAVRAVAARL